jgi:hypothetical protein
MRVKVIEQGDTYTGTLGTLVSRDPGVVWIKTDLDGSLNPFDPSELTLAETPEQVWHDAVYTVEQLEKDLTVHAAQNAYHAIVRCHTEGQDITGLRERYYTAVEIVNDRFPS